MNPPMRPFRIALLFLPRDRPEEYGISAYAELWKADGLSVHILRGINEYVPADVLFLHINLTVVPESILTFARRYPKVINLHATDIRKRAFSTLLLSPDSNYAGEVIVKTDLNHAGDPEARFHPDWTARLASRWQKLRLKAVRGRKHVTYYPVYASIKEVPSSVWRNPNWLVEKFLPERQGEQYVIRNYRFLGNHESSLLLTSKQPFIREDSIIQVCSIEPEPLLQELRRKMRMDYGKFDYVLVQGQPVVIDINKTMGYNPHASHNPEVIRTRKHLAAGIFDFLA